MKQLLIKGEYKSSNYISGNLGEKFPTLSMCPPYLK